jgi:hypothetical protein
VAFGELSKPGEFGPKFFWTCPRNGCKYSTASWTAAGLNIQREFHDDFHYKEDRDRLAAFREELVRAPKAPVDYDRLHVNWADICFLITRGIAIDEDVIFEPSMKYEVNHEQNIKQTLWKRILEKVWS